MHLSSLTLKGFKSFPDRTRLEFSPGVSVIVGPNGSGKSNVTDAVLWALGEQSPVAVRGQSMQDVIFAGGHGRPARAEAEVEVVLDNGDGEVDVPFGELSIVRRLTRTGEGEYRVNGTRCRLSDVLELLSDTGLGREMHSVVSQGRVEAIVTSKPRDRRLLIEEAAGLGKHRKRRRRAQLKLDRTQSNLDRALDVEREARTRLRPLKRQAEAAELHLRLERQADEARWELAREAVRAAGEELSAAQAAALARGRGPGGGARRPGGRRGGRAGPRRGRGTAGRGRARPRRPGLGARAPGGPRLRRALGRGAHPRAPRGHAAGHRRARGARRSPRGAHRRPRGRPRRARPGGAGPDRWAGGGGRPAARGSPGVARRGAARARGGLRRGRGGVRGPSGGGASPGDGASGGRGGGRGCPARPACARVRC